MEPTTRRLSARELRGPGVEVAPAGIDLSCKACSLWLRWADPASHRT